jgi:tetratricopeptide (TPR) repeat protein
MPAPEPSPVTLKKRKIPIWQQILNWYLKLRLLNKIALLLLLAAIPTAAIGYKVLRPAYKEWKQRNALALAASCIARKDDKGAVLAFRRAIMANPKNPRVWEQLGTYLESKKSPEALWVWDRLAMVQPTTGNHLRVAKAALAIGDWQRARTHLDAVPEAERSSWDYRLLSAQTLAASNQVAKAESLITQVLKEHPDNADAVFLLGQIRMNSTDPAVRAQAQVQMRALADGKGPRAMEALRLLTIQEMRTGQNMLAASDAGELIKRPEAQVSDQLLFLDLEFMTQSFSLPISIEKARKLALANPENTRPIISYLIRRGLAAETLAWLERQPPETVNASEVFSVHLDLAISARDWDKVYALLAKADPPIAPEMLTKLRTIQDDFRADKPDAITKWGELASGARNNLFLLGTMEQLSAAWNWPQGREKVLWTISEVVPSNQFVWKELLPIELRAGNTPAVLRILAALTALDPSNQQLRTSWLTLQFLLQRGEGKDLLGMAEADAKVSDAPEVQVIYAALLADAGRTDDAITVIEKIPAEARNTPRIAAYLTYVYAKAKKPDVVKSLLGVVQGDTKGLLNEEIALAQRSLAIAEQRPEDSIPSKAAQAMDEESAARVLHELEGLRADPGADRQRLLEQLKSQGVDATGANDQLKRLRQELQKDAASTPAPRPVKP